MKKKWKSWLLLAAPYLLTALIPVISVLFLGNTIMRTYQERQIAEKQNSIQISFDRMVQKAESVENVGVMLGSSSLLAQYSSACLNHSGHDQLTNMEIMDLFTTAVLNPVIYNVYLFDVKDNAVISAETAVSNMQAFFRYSHRLEGYTIEESISRLANMSSVHRVFPTVTLRLSDVAGATKELVEYRLGLPMGWVKNAQSQLIIAMDADELFRDFKETVLPEGEFYVYDDNNILIYQSGNLYEELLPLSAPAEIQKLTYNGDDLYGAVLKTSNGAWKVKVFMPDLTEQGSIEFLSPAFVLLVVLPMIACVLLTIFFTHKNYRSILDLVNLFSSHAGEQPKEQEIMDYRLVQQYAGQVIAEKNRMTQRITEYTYSRKYEVLDKLVRNTYQSREEALRALAETDLAIRDGRNAVLCISCPADTFDTLVPGGATIRETVRRLVGELLDQPYVLFDTSAKEITCVISLETEDTPDLLVQGIVSHLNVEVAYRYGIEILLGAGNPTQHIHRLGESLEQARAVIRYRELSGSHVNLYSELTDLEDLYYYPREYDEKILDYVVAGKKEEALALVRKIYEEHFEKEGSMPSVRAINAIKSRLWDCVVFIAEKYGIPREEMDSNDQGQSLARIRGEMSARRYFALICEKIDLLSRHIQEKKNTGQNSLVNRIMDYVSENYCDNTLSLKQISEALGVHENYISNLFKATYGENLSSYVEKLRIEKACELILGSSMKIEEIAGNVGYTSGASFRRAFKKVKGISPAEYRDK